jgi:hypothetical protein
VGVGVGAAFLKACGDGIEHSLFFVKWC